MLLNSGFPVFAYLDGVHVGISRGGKAELFRCSREEASRECSSSAMEILCHSAWFSKGHRQCTHGRRAVVSAEESLL